MIVDFPVPKSYSFQAAIRCISRQITQWCEKNEMPQACLLRVGAHNGTGMRNANNIVHRYVVVGG